MPRVAHADLSLLHCLEQGRLGLRRCAVDLVGQHHVGKERALQKSQLSAATTAILFQYLGADYVGWHQVGSELDPTEGEVEAAGQRADEQRLGESGHTFQQTVPAGEE